MEDRYLCANILTQQCTLRQWQMQSKFAARLMIQLGFVACCVLSPCKLPVSAGWFIAPLDNARYRREKNNMAIGHSCCSIPSDTEIAFKYCFSWRKRKYIKITAIEKLKERRTYIVKTGVLLVENIRLFSTYATS